MHPQTSFAFPAPLIVLSFIMLLFQSGPAMGEAGAAFQSTEVHADGSITFRFQDPSAKKVLLHLDGFKDPFAMKKGAENVWSVVSPALSPEIYGYSFEVDGQPRNDPKNPATTPNLIFFGNMVTVPGATPQLWEAQDVPHGVVHHHFYKSKIVQDLPGGQSEFYVYTPPLYEPSKATAYPVFYLLHGWSDMANGWTAVGKANFIFDNLIAAGQMKPMVVVMPLGYGDIKFVSGGENMWNDNAAIHQNVDLFSQTLLSELIPQVESLYHVSQDKDDRAIAGLSMGGLESLTIGLTHPERFGWIGGFSSALGHHDEEQFAQLTHKPTGLHLLWIACGTEDRLITPNRAFTAWLKSNNIPLTEIETPGMHTWMVWRDNLAHFAPLLFR